jgi:oligopeptide/dipeptide ABC transporter ATP-binding protein
VPDGFRVPSGCVFHPRCPSVQGEKCRSSVPPAVRVGEGHTVSCVLYGE